MNSFRRVIPSILVLLLLAGGFCRATFADSSHARIVRLSLVQGDVRFARDVKGDPLGDAQLGWESAVLNLPMRQGYVLATDNGRAEVEFENGALAFLAENSVLQFYDLSSEDGGFTTRLILRQGSAEFYVNPSRGDYFSVTGGDFSVEADGKATFRMNNFDDGSNVAVLHGRVTALAGGKNTELAKGQTFSMRAGEPDSAETARAPDSDEFDQWASGRISTSSAATNAGLAYSNDSGYAAGYGDLYTYGAWFPVGGYGYCWRPYGVGFAWSPFDTGTWYYDPFYGWSFLGGYAWGWLPYHYGGWLFQPGVGWVWSPTGTMGSPGVGRWRPVTGVWMRNSTGTVAIVPAHPLDGRGRTPINMAQGFYEVTPRGVTGPLASGGDGRWKVENRPASDLIQNQLADASAPARVSRTLPTSTAGRGNGEPSSTIVYDPSEHRFVNSNTAPSAGASAGPAATQKGMRVYPEQRRASEDTQASAARQGQSRQIAPAMRTPPPPPSVPRSVTNERAFVGNGAASEGARGASGAGREAPASSTGAGRSTGGSSAPSGGGRPH
jgi:hypothetical protein